MRDQTSVHKIYEVMNTSNELCMIYLHLVVLRPLGVGGNRPSDRKRCPNLVTRAQRVYNIRACICMQLAWPCLQPIRGPPMLVACSQSTQFYHIRPGSLRSTG